MKIKKSWPLTIFLVREGIDDSAQIIAKEDCSKSFELSIPGCEFATLFVKPVAPKVPKWTALFDGLVEASQLGKASSVAAALLVRVGETLFVITFGYGRYLIRDNTCEDRFGLVVTLNSVQRNSLRCVDIQSLDAIQSHSRIQSGLEVPADQFGLNVEQDMLKAVVGAPSKIELGSRMTGSDALAVSVRMDLYDLPNLLAYYYSQFQKDLSATDYAWVNNINLLKSSSSLIDTLDAKMIAKFHAEDYQDIWLAIPEIIDWNRVNGFRFQGGGKAMYSDVTLSGFLSTILAPEEISLTLLKNRKVVCVDEDHNPTGKTWSVYKCLYAEIEESGEKYIFNGGLWYRVDSEFVTRTNNDFKKIPKCQVSLPAYSGGGEGFYNKSVANSDPNTYDLLDDKKKVFHGGGHGQVEICDIFTKSRQLIHVKRYGKSSVLSHLFAQGFVSGQLIQLDKEFRKKVVEKLGPKFKNLIDIENRPADKSCTIVYGIISESTSKELHLPFFSRVNLNNTYRELVGFGYNVELLKIDVDPDYAMTKKLPPGKAKKL